MARYSVIVPTFNERDNIAPFIWMVAGTFQKLDVDWEIVVVDDNSPDGTAAMVTSMQSLLPQGKVILVERPGKLGLGALLHCHCRLVPTADMTPPQCTGTAYKEGITRSTGDYVLFMDADFSHHPHDIDEFVRKQQVTKCDIVASTRYRYGGGVAGWSFKRKLTSRGANVLAATLLQPGQVSDLTGAYRLYRRSCLEKVMPLVTSKGYAFQMEIIVRAHHMGYHIEEVPIVFVDRLFGDSKLGAEEVVMYIKGLARLLCTL